jgi:peptidoglycan/xylan/chitin deacetylase (PgdA/CDA1 family)/glycosyltransferase involved in cell wall biosynthesis
MKLSVVIPTYNRRKALERTLPALLAQDFPPSECEVVVVVDGSTDGTLEFLSRVKSPFRLKVLSQPNRGPGAARNAGLASAEGDLVAFFDDDIICTSGVLSQHCAAHAGADPLWVHGPIYIAPESPRTLIRYKTEVQHEAYYGRLDPAAEIRFPEDLYFLSGSNVSIRRETLLAHGGFDERAPDYEDVELGLRLWKAGLRFRYLASAVVYELFVKPSWQFLQKQVNRKFARSEFYISRRHPEYRPQSGLAGAGDPLGLKQLVKNMLVRAPLSPLPLFKVPLWIAERLYGFVPVRKAGVRLLDAAGGIEMLRSALREAGSWKALRREFGMKLPVLLYHHVGPPQPDTDPDLTVSPERFEAQVRWLARKGYVGIRLTDWLAWRRAGKPLAEKPVLLTFDDAYEDTAQYALPVLERHGFGAAVFVITGRVGGTIAWDQRKGAFRLMSAEQIRYWANKGIEFGAHSRTHPNLTTLGPAELAEEVAGSKRDLEAILQSPVLSFAYPYGLYNPVTCECVRKLYDVAFTVDRGLNDLRTDPHILHRTDVLPGDFMVDLASRLRWGFSPLQRLRSRIRFRTRLKSAARAVLARSH